MATSRLTLHVLIAALASSIVSPTSAALRGALATGRTAHGIPALQYVPRPPKPCWTALEGTSRSCSLLELVAVAAPPAQRRSRPCGLAREFVAAVNFTSKSSGTTAIGAMRYSASKKALLLAIPENSGDTGRVLHQLEHGATARSLRGTQVALYDMRRGRQWSSCQGCHDRNQGGGSALVSAAARVSSCASTHELADSDILQSILPPRCAAATAAFASNVLWGAEADDAHGVCPQRVPPSHAAKLAAAANRRPSAYLARIFSRGVLRVARNNARRSWSTRDYVTTWGSLTPVLAWPRHAWRVPC